MRYRLLIAIAVLFAVSMPGSAVAGFFDQITDSVDFFVSENLLKFQADTVEKERIFQSRFGGVCEGQPPQDDDKKPKPKKKPPEPKKKPPKPFEHPPIPNGKPGRNGAGPGDNAGAASIITPGAVDPRQRTTGTNYEIEFLDAVGEVDIPVSGFDPLNESQVVSTFSGGFANNEDVAPEPVREAVAAVAPPVEQNNNAVATPPPAPIVVNPTFNINAILGAIPDTAYFSIDPATGQPTELPSAAGADVSFGTDNATDAFSFAIPPNTQTTPPIPPGLSASFPIGATVVYVFTIGGSNIQITITVGPTSVSLQTRRL